MTNNRKGNEQLTWESSCSYCSDLNRIQSNLEPVSEGTQAKKDDAFLQYAMDTFLRNETGYHKLSS